MILFFWRRWNNDSFLLQKIKKIKKKKIGKKESILKNPFRRIHSEKEEFFKYFK